MEGLGFRLQSPGFNRLPPQLQTFSGFHGVGLRVQGSGRSNTLRE